VLKTINKNMFDLVAALMIIAVLFYLAVITHIMPLPENAMRGIAENSLNVWNVLVTCLAWLFSFLH